MKKKRKVLYNVMAVFFISSAISCMPINATERGAETATTTPATTKATQQQIYLKQLHDKYSHLDIVEVQMFPQEVKGLERLRDVGTILSI